MAWEKHILVVANVTATSRELVEALRAEAAPRAARFTLLMPANRFGGDRPAAQEKLDQACAQLREKGLQVDGLVGDSDPYVAVTETWDPRAFDEIIVATLPMRISKWLHAGLPERISRLTGVPVTHVIAQPHVEPEIAPAPAHERPALGPLTVLGWGARPRRGRLTARDRGPRPARDA